VFSKKNFDSISPTKFKPNLFAEICQMLFAVCPVCDQKKTFHPVRSKNQRVHEIDPSRQFHQHFMGEFFIRKSFRQLFSSYVLAKKHFGMKKMRVKC
jgi:hypothetical protein